MKTKKGKKSRKLRGKGMGTHGWGARKKHKKKGHRGGKGMSGSGKRADHKKTLIIKKYGSKYFGKRGITSKGTKRDIRKRINVGEIDMNLEKYGKKVGDKWGISLKDYKILGQGEVKNKLFIKARGASKSAIKKIKKAGGDIILNSKDTKSGKLDKSENPVETKREDKSQRT